MIRSIWNKRLIAVLLLLSIYGFSHGQDNWKLQPVVMKTRWAENVFPSAPLPEYPRPQMRRSTGWINLNGIWQYAITKNNVNSPSNYQGNILVPYPIESALSGVQTQLLPDQYLWYKKSFNYKKKNGLLLLHFGAVDYKAWVYLNGKEIGIHEGGYTSFEFDVSSFIKDGENEIIVKVLDPTDQGIGPHGKQVLNPENIYYTASSGIWQSVWLEEVPRMYIKKLKIDTDIDRQRLLLSLSLSKESNFDIEALITSNGRIINRIQVNYSPDSVVHIEVPNMHLWSPQDPFLYDLKIRLLKGRRVVDELYSYFGMRKVSISEDEKGVPRIFLNNKYVFNLGVLDQGFWPEGLYTAPTDEALAFDIKAIKEMGFNTIRKHIKVEPARWYYHADKIGVLVWQDLVNPNQMLREGSKTAFEQQSGEILSQLHNYPSITTWVLFNERWGAYDQGRLTKWVKEQDSTRIVNGHSGELLYVNDKLREASENPYLFSDISDVHSYPNPRMPLARNGMARVIGEFGGIGVPVPGHQWNDISGWGYVQVTASEFLHRYQALIDSLSILEKNGLSGAIYTEPFDVEGEENGIMTYDRRIIKMPLKSISQINSKLVETGGPKNSFVFVGVSDINTDDNDSKYPILLNEYKGGKGDSTLLRRLLLIAVRKVDTANIASLQKAYLKVIYDVYNKHNLRLLDLVIRSTADSGFTVFFNNSKNIDSVLGKNFAENKIIDLVAREKIIPFSSQKYRTPNWDSIENVVRSQYGSLGEEAVYGHRMVFHWSNEDWVKFGEYYKKYFTLSIPQGRSFININNLSWSIFEHVQEKDVLDCAIKTMQLFVTNVEPENHQAIDTYANLLYKSGERNEAIKWENKAHQLDKSEGTYIETISKMERNISTWK